MYACVCPAVLTLYVVLPCASKRLRYLATLLCRIVTFWLHVSDPLPMPIGSLALPCLLCLANLYMTVTSNIQKGTNHQRHFRDPWRTSADHRQRTRHPITSSTHMEPITNFIGGVVETVTDIITPRPDVRCSPLASPSLKPSNAKPLTRLLPRNLTERQAEDLRQRRRRLHRQPHRPRAPQCGLRGRRLRQPVQRHQGGAGACRGHDG